MGDKKKDKKDKKHKIKEECCEKYIRKGKHCKDCPIRGECRLPAEKD